MTVRTLDSAGREFLPKLIMAAREVIANQLVSEGGTERPEITQLREILADIDSIHWVKLFVTSRL